MEQAGYIAPQSAGLRGHSPLSRSPESTSEQDGHVGCGSGAKRQAQPDRQVREELRWQCRLGWSPGVRRIWSGEEPEGGHSRESDMASFQIQVGGSELSGGEAEKVGRVRCGRAGMSLRCCIGWYSCASSLPRAESPGGELILAGCHLRGPQLLFCIWLGLEGWCKWRTGVGVRHTPKDKVHLTFRGR